MIRAATIQDVSSIQEIAKLTWPNTYTFLPDGQIEYMLEKMYSFAILSQQIKEDHQFFLFELAGKPIGFAGVSNEGNSIFKLNKLYVLPAIQKTGAGKALLNTVIAYAKQNGGTHLQLQVNRHNNAKSFYEKNGFIVLYDADFDIGNGYFMNDHVMELKLT